MAGPRDAFVIGALPTGFVTRGSPQIVDAVSHQHGAGRLSARGRGIAVDIGLKPYDNEIAAGFIGLALSTTP